MGSDYLTEILAGAIAPIAEEMFGRIEVELSEKDRLAISTALGKVAFASARAAMAETAAAETTDGADPSRPSVSFEYPGTDGWAELYGGG